MDTATTPNPPALSDESFDAFYYGNCCGRPYLRDEHWLSFFGRVAERVVVELQPKRVLDAGCALGLLVETLRDRGVDAYGIDVSSYAIEHVDPSVSRFCRRQSLTEPLDERYDLVISIEVLEHMPTADALRAIENICRCTDRVLFSSSPFDYREPTHINVHPTDYWAEQFALHGFYRDVDFDGMFLTSWATLFRKSEEPLHRIVRQYERRYWEMHCNASGARSYSMEIQNRLAQTESERDSLRAQAGAALATASAGVDAANAFVAERESLQARVDELQATVAAQGVAIVAAAAERDALRAALNEAEANIAARIAENAAVATERDALRATLNESEANIAARIAENAALAVEREELARRLLNATDSIKYMEGSSFWRLRNAYHRAREFIRSIMR